tara:strand:+ start:33 stop:383 length:351 start_codon:yes stop_codon:yes gene_type:complete
MNENRELLVENIRTWLQLDTELKNIQKKAKELRKNKKDVTQNLTKIMRENEIDCFDINNGKLIYYQRNVKKPLSKKHLIESLAKYFKNDKHEVSTISNFIMNTRDSKVVENIRIKK